MYSVSSVAPDVHTEPSCNAMSGRVNKVAKHSAAASRVGPLSPRYPKHISYTSDTSVESEDCEAAAILVSKDVMSKGTNDNIASQSSSIYRISHFSWSFLSCYRKSQKWALSVVYSPYLTLENVKTRLENSNFVREVFHNVLVTANATQKLKHTAHNVQSRNFHCLQTSGVRYERRNSIA
jgi:hypothetical protein